MPTTSKNRSPKPESDSILTRLGTAHRALAEARTIEDFKKVADIATAAEVYTRRVKLSQETVDYALEIKLRAERGLGEMLARTPEGERRPAAFIRRNTKESTIPDPIGALTHTTLERLRKNPIEYFPELAGKVKEEPDAVDLYNFCYDIAERISAMLDELEVKFPSLKGTRE